MKKTYVAALALALTPFAWGHEPRGTPKPYCEKTADRLVHEYAPPAAGRVVALFDDGAKTARKTLGCPHPIWGESAVDEGDGHSEFAVGGAWLLVTSGAGQPSPDPTVGAGSLWCYGEEGHHANFATVTVDDALLGAGAEVTIGADGVDLTGVGEGCGDFEDDMTATGVGTITATFPAGLDGAYTVYVTGTQGHVSSN